MSGDNNGEKPVGETLEEAGALEADVGATFDQQLAGIDPRLNITMDPFAHRDLRPEMMFIREELRQAKWQTLAIRQNVLLGLGIRFAYYRKFKSSTSYRKVEIESSEIQSRLEKWQQKLENVGLKISKTKTEYMF